MYGPPSDCKEKAVGEKTSLRKNRPTNKDRYARNSSWPGALCSTKGRSQDGEKILLTRNGHIVAILRGYRMRETDQEWIAKIINNISAAGINMKHKAAKRQKC
jgi:hypothetical protein